MRLQIDDSATQSTKDKDKDYFEYANTRTYVLQPEC